MARTRPEDYQGHSYVQKVRDPLHELMHELRTNPTSRRLLLSSWNVSQLDKMALPPCHFSFQLVPSLREKTISMQVTMRSADIFLGVPFNVASYALLLSMICHVSGYTPGTLKVKLTHAHLYHNHFKQADVQLSRIPWGAPRIELSKHVREVWGFKPEDIKLLDYHHEPVIPATVAV